MNDDLIGRKEGRRKVKEVTATKTQVSKAVSSSSAAMGILDCALVCLCDNCRKTNTTKLTRTTEWT